MYLHHLLYLRKSNPSPLRSSRCWSERNPFVFHAALYCRCHTKPCSALAAAAVAISRRYHDRGSLWLRNVQRVANDCNINRTMAYMGFCRNRLCDLCCSCVVSRERERARVWFIIIILYYIVHNIIMPVDLLSYKIYIEVETQYYHNIRPLGLVCDIEPMVRVVCEMWISASCYLPYHIYNIIFYGVQGWSYMS